MSDAICAGADPVPSASQVPPQNAAKTDSQSLEEPQEVPTSQETSSDPSEDSTSLSEAGHVEAMHGDTDSQEDAEGGVSLSEGRTEIHNYMHEHYHVHNDTFMFRTEKHNHQHHEHHHHYHWHFHSQSWQPQANNGHPEMLPGVGPQPQPPNTSSERQDQDAQTRSQALVRSDGQHEGCGAESQLSRPTKLRRMNASYPLEADYTGLRMVACCHNALICFDQMQECHRTPVRHQW